jgi:hypothetical protein
MKKPGFVTAATLLLVLTVVAGCGPGTTAVTDYASLVRQLNKSEDSVEALGNTEQPTVEAFSGKSKWIKIDGEVVNVWEYADEATAAREAGFVKYDGFDLRRPADAASKGTYEHIDWIAPSHWYRAGRIIVLYVGKRWATIDLLESLVGPRYAGEGIGPPPVTDFQSFMGNLLLSGARVKALRDTAFQGDMQQSFFSGNGKRIELNSENVSLLEYQNEATAAAEAGFISKDGYSYTSEDGRSIVNISWVAPPHFYRAGRIIVLYVGENRQTIDLLETLLGPPFAGEGTKN